MYEIKQFFDLCGAEEQSLIVFHVDLNRQAMETGDPAKLLGQTDPGAIFIASRFTNHFGREWRGGRVSLANYKLAGRRIVEESHEIASAEQIAAMWAEQAARKLEYAAAEERISGKKQVSVSLLNPEVKA